MKRILIAGIGNIFHGDDAFGVEVARELSSAPPREGVTVVDFGIRSYDLAYALTGGYDAVILIDAVHRGVLPGTVCLIEPDRDHLEASGAVMDAHAMTPASVLTLARSLGEVAAQVFIVGCEPASLVCESGELGLSAPVREAVPDAVKLIDSLLNDLSKTNETKPAGLVPA